MANPAPIQSYLDGNSDTQPLDGEPDPAWAGGQGRDDSEVADAGEAIATALVILAAIGAVLVLGGLLA